MSPTPEPSAEERIRDAITAVRDAPNPDAFAGTSPRGGMLDRLLADAYPDPWALTLDLRLALAALAIVALTAVVAVAIDRSARSNRARADYGLRRAYDEYDRRRAARQTAEQVRAADAELRAEFDVPPAPTATED